MKLRLASSLDQSAASFIQLLSAVAASVGGHRRSGPPRLLLPQLPCLASDQLELFRSERAKGKQNFWSQVEEVGHGYGWAAVTFSFSSPGHGEAPFSSRSRTPLTGLTQLRNLTAHRQKLRGLRYGYQATGHKIPQILPPFQTRGFSLILSYKTSSH